MQLRNIACCLLHASFLVGFDLEDGGDISLETSVDFHGITRRYITEDRTLQEVKKESQEE
jgi:hypothetical protein